MPLLAADHAGDLGREHHLRERLLDALGQRLHQVAVGAGQQPGRHLDDRHLGAERGVDRAELQADVAAADDQQRLGDLGQIERPGRVEHPRAVDRQPGDARRVRTGGEHQVVALHLLGAGRRLHRQRRRAGDGRPALHVGDLAQLGHLAGAAGQLLDHLVLVGAQLVEIDLRRRRTRCPRPWRASTRRAPWPRAAAPSTGCSRDRGRRRRGSSPRRPA